MTNARRIVAIGTILAAIFCCGSVLGANPDPYTVLDKYIAANGGLEKMKAQKTTYMKGTLVIEGAGIQGTLEQWTQAPLKTRQVTDLRIFKQTSGDNGQVAWSLDQNNKLQISRDSVTLKEREVRRLMADYEHFSRTSKVFKVTFDRIDTALGTTCVVLKTTNTIDPNVSFDFYDTLTYRQIKSTVDKPKQISHTYFSDFRMVEGIPTPFKMRQVEEPTNQVVSITIDSLTINQPVDSALFEPPFQDVRDFEFANGNTMETVSIKFMENHLYLPLTINGKTKLWVLDSGAESSVIEEAFAKELGLTLEGNLTGQGVGSTVNVSFTTLPKYSIGGLSFQEQKIACIKLNWLFKKTMGMEIGGILGYDFLSRLVTKVDFANQTLTFYDPDSFHYAGAGVVLDAPLSQDKMFHVPVTVDSVYGGLWNLDLGANGMSFHFPYAESHDLLSRKGYTSVSFGAGGSSQSKTCQFQTITFAGFTKAKPLVGMPLAADKGAFSSREITGNAGNTLFRHFVLYLDYKHEKVIVERGPDFDKVFPEDGSGLQLALSDDGQMEVLAVSDGTPAEKAKIKAGDKVLSINGKSLEALGGIVKARELLKAAPGTKYVLAVVRDGKEKKTDLTLKKLFE